MEERRDGTGEEGGQELLELAIVIYGRPFSISTRESTRSRRQILDRASPCPKP